MKGILDLRNIFDKKTLAHSGLLVFAILTVVGILFLMPEPAHADFVSDISEGIIDFLVSLMLKVLTIIVIIAAFLINLVLLFFTWFAKMFMELLLNLTLTHTYTSGPIFKAGWTVMRDLANMLLVIVFVAIGVGTMLNLQTINKRMLGRFFVVALLINFTPLITGIIIDLSNIAGYVFWDSAKQGGTALIGRSEFGSFSALGDIGKDFSIIFDGGYAEIAGILVKTLVSVLMNFLLIFVYLLLSFIFLGRTIILTILVIISPLAFIGLIFKR